MSLLSLFSTKTFQTNTNKMKKLLSILAMLLIGFTVKQADLEHNTQISRLKGLTKSDFARIEKYHKAYTYLSKI